MENDIQQDSGRYLQEYVQSLENLPSEIKYHWAEVLNRNETAQSNLDLERRVHVHQHDLAKLHKQWFHPEIEKRQKIQRHEPVLIKRIQRDYDKLQDLATERIELMEGALQLVDRHLHRLGSDLDLVDNGGHITSSSSHTARPQVSISSSSSSQTPRINKRPVYDEEEDEEELEDEEGEVEPYVETVKQQLQQRQLQQPTTPQQNRKKRKERDEINNEEEPLYCYCRQVSFGEMVGCDGENCPYEWFHMECLGLTEPPAGKWYCNDCLAEIQKRNPNHRQTTPTRNKSGGAHAHHPQKKLKRKKEST